MSPVNDSTQWSYENHINPKNARVDMEYDYTQKAPTTPPTKKINRKKINIIVLSILSVVFLIVGGGCSVLLLDTINAYLPS